MSITGSLADVSVAEVMQFVSIGQRTGTLRLCSANDQVAEVGFHRGRIVSSRAPGSRRLGEVLGARGLIAGSALEEALRLQQHERPRRSLGQILTATGAIAPETLRQVMGEEIGRTINELVTWSDGTFDFVPEDLRPIDDVGMFPGDLLSGVELNTEAVVLDALRRIDEHRHRERGSPDPEGAPGLEAEAPRSGVGGAAEMVSTATLFPQAAGETLFLEGAVPRLVAGEAAPQPASRITRLQVVSSDEALPRELAAALCDEAVHVVRVGLHDAGSPLPGEPPPLVLVDLRDGEIGLDRLRSLIRVRPRASVLTLIDASSSAGEAYEAGSAAVLPFGREAVVACLRTFLRRRTDPPFIDEGPAKELKVGLAKLRRVVADLRSGLLSGTMALNLMNVISESVERAVLFFVARETLVPLGAFGFGASGRPLAELTQGLRFSLQEANGLTEIIDQGRARSMRYEEARLPEAFARAVGRPYTGQVVIIPVLGSESVIAVVYTDNGPYARSLEDVEVLELAAAQVGVAFENEILRRRLSDPKRII